MYNTVALCPNCHKKMHVLKDKKDLKDLIEKLKQYTLKENDNEQIQKFKILFKL